MSSVSIIVDVVAGGPGREAAVSRKSAAAVTAALEQAGCDVRLIDVDQGLDVTSVREGAVVFNVIHGTYGEDGVLQSQLDASGIAYVGSGAAASRLCMDKYACKKTLEQNGLPVPWGVLVDPQAGMTDQRKLGIPVLTGLVVKPACDGSSVGLRMLPSPSFLLPALEEVIADVGPVPLLVEEQLSGPEYTVSIIDDEAGAPQALQPIQVVPAEGSYDYEAKYHRNDTRYEPVTNESLATELMKLAVQAYRVCGCRDLARVDIMSNASSELRVLEVNTLPGCTDHSLLPKSAERAGIPFGQLCVRLVQRAQTRSQQHGGV